MSGKISIELELGMKFLITDLSNSYWMKLDKASQSSQYLTSGDFTYYSTGGVFRDLQSSNRQTVTI